MILLFDNKRALCYSKKCAIVESYAMISQKNNEIELFFGDSASYMGNKTQP